MILKIITFSLIIFNNIQDTGRLCNCKINKNLKKEFDCFYQILDTSYKFSKEIKVSFDSLTKEKKIDTLLNTEYNVFLLRFASRYFYALTGVESKFVYDYGTYRYLKNEDYLEEKGRIKIWYEENKCLKKYDNFAHKIYKEYIKALYKATNSRYKMRQERKWLRKMSKKH